MENSENIWEKIHSQKDWGKYPNEELVRHVALMFFKVAKEKRGDIKILEIGCGQGANLWFLAKNGFDAYGIDISESAIGKAEKYMLHDYGVRPRLSVADARKLSFPNETFDAVIDCATIQHLSHEDHKKAYSEACRILKRGGLFWSFHIADRSWGYDANAAQIDYKTFDNLAGGLLANYGVVCMLSDADIELLLKNEGFSKIQIERNARTYENQKREIVHWDVEAIKP